MPEIKKVSDAPDWCQRGLADLIRRECATQYPNIEKLRMLVGRKPTPEIWEELETFMPLEIVGALKMRIEREEREIKRAAETIGLPEPPLYLTARTCKYMDDGVLVIWPVAGGFHHVGHVPGGYHANC
jgi:hypothetical protein